jgi:large subunit ribosomal protein L24
MTGFKIKKNDLVKILSGKDRGSSGRIISVLPKEGRIVIEGLNLLKRHRRPRRQGEKGQIVQMPAPMPISKAMLVCPSCQKAQRPKMIIDASGRKSRICRKCSSPIP